MCAFAYRSSSLLYSVCAPRTLRRRRGERERRKKALHTRTGEHESFPCGAATAVAAFMFSRGGFFSSPRYIGECACVVVPRRGSSTRRRELTSRAQPSLSTTRARRRRRLEAHIQRVLFSFSLTLHYLSLSFSLAARCSLLARTAPARRPFLS